SSRWNTGSHASRRGLISGAAGAAGSWKWELLPFDTHASRRGLIGSAAGAAGQQAGSGLIPQIALVELDSVPFEHCHEFFLKGHAFMMLFLILNIDLYRTSIRFADGECSISALPAKASPLGPRFMHPARRVGFNFADEICEGNLR